MDQEGLLNNRYRIIEAQSSKIGNYGFVNKAIDTQNQQIVAIKEIKERVGQQGLGPTILRETSILNKLNDTNIVKLIDFFVNVDRIFLVFPYVETNLRQLMVNRYQSNVPQNIIKRVMSQLLSALRSAHSARFMHRDIKPDNILVEKSQQNSDDFVIKLADWGSSRRLSTYSDQNFTQQVIALGYRPPELLFGTRKYTQTVDIWSAGCLFAQLLFGERICKSRSSIDILHEIWGKIGLIQVEDYNWTVQKYLQYNQEEVIKQLKKFQQVNLDNFFKQRFGQVTPACDLLKKMLRINPEKRISAFDALKHPYFDFNN